MKKQIITILGIIFLISLVSAITIFSGESYSFQSEEFAFFSVIGNSSDIEGMNISWENGNTTISFHQAFKSDNFTLILFNPDKEVITEYVYSGGGGGSSGSSTIYRDRNITKTEVITIPGEKETETIPGDTITITEDKIPPWIWYVGGVGIGLVLVLCVLIFLIMYINKEDNQED